MVVTIIAGSRTIEDIAEVRRAIEASGIPVSEVVSGCARGVDSLGEQWAAANDVPISQFRADWGKYGRARAGFIRNQEMVDYAKKHNGALIAVWDGSSRGTAHCIEAAKAAGLDVFVYNPAQSVLSFDWVE